MYYIYDYMKYYKTGFHLFCIAWIYLDTMRGSEFNKIKDAPNSDRIQGDKFSNFLFKSKLTFLIKRITFTYVAGPYAGGEFRG